MVKISLYLCIIDNKNFTLLAKGLRYVFGINPFYQPHKILGDETLSSLILLLVQFEGPKRNSADKCTLRRQS